MASQIFRTRGLVVHLDTTAPAEFDIKGYQISDVIMDRIGSRLKSLPHSPQDQLAGDIRVRRLEGYDVLFFVSRDQTGLIVTIVGVVPEGEQDTLANVRKILEVLALMRSASGV